jgi:hypothetical protein
VIAQVWLVPAATATAPVKFETATAVVAGLPVRPSPS